MGHVWEGGVIVGYCRVLWGTVGYCGGSCTPSLGQTMPGLPSAGSLHGGSGGGRQVMERMETKLVALCAEVSRRAEVPDFATVEGLQGYLLAAVAKRKDHGRREKRAKSMTAAKQVPCPVSLYRCQNPAQGPPSPILLRVSGIRSYTLPKCDPLSKTCIVLGFQIFANFLLILRQVSTALASRTHVVLCNCANFPFFLLALFYLQ